jgi:hypothetical protein
MLRRLSMGNNNSIPSKHKRSGSKIVNGSHSKSRRTASWFLDESNSSSGSRIYQKTVDESLIALLPESSETFIENNTIIGKLAKFILNFAD